ncbi:MAG: aminoglycoside phosphotransferase family protein [Actinomycetota bacterium]
MSAQKMHEGQIDIDADLVRRLLEGQFPQWAGLPLARYSSTGTVNAIYRLGDEMYVRLPLVKEWAWHIKAEGTWLPRMRPHMPVEIPEVLGNGEPTDAYPLQWSIQRWIEGGTWGAHGVSDDREGALDLASFLKALWSVDTTGEEPLDPQFDVPLLAAHDEWIRESIELSKEWIDADALTAAWDAALELPPFGGPYVWVHSDLGPDNLLVRDGRFAAVIDWGSLHVGDAARDLCVWPMFSRDARAIFRDTLEVDDATWARARAWVIRAVGGIHFYVDSNPSHMRMCIEAIEVLLEEVETDG